jgi:hypothetical protein
VFVFVDHNTIERPRKEGAMKADCLCCLQLVLSIGKRQTQPMWQASSFLHAIGPNILLTGLDPSERVAQTIVHGEGYARRASVSFLPCRRISLHSPSRARRKQGAPCLLGLGRPAQRPSLAALGVTRRLRAALGGRVHSLAAQCC